MILVRAGVSSTGFTSCSRRMWQCEASRFMNQVSDSLAESRGLKLCVTIRT